VLYDPLCQRSPLTSSTRSSRHYCVGSLATHIIQWHLWWENTHQTLSMSQVSSHWRNISILKHKIMHTTNVILTSLENVCPLVTCCTVPKL
jgi:hypothetical protein